MTTVIATSAQGETTAPVTDKVNLLGMPLAAMEQFFLDIGEKKFRAQQVLKWIHHHGVTDFDEMSNAVHRKSMHLHEIALNSRRRRMPRMNWFESSFFFFCPLEFEINDHEIRERI